MSEWPTNKRFITDTGTLDAPIMVIGEAGGREENAQGKPFVGAAGHVLDKCLKEVGLTRDDLYITNVVPYQPPIGNDFESIPPALLAHYKEELCAKINSSRACVVVPLGNHALHAICGHVGIMKWRGSVRNFNEKWTVATIHPAATLRSPALLKTSFYDWRRINEIASKGWTEAPKNLICTVWNDARLLQLRMARALSVDIETVRGTSKVLCIAFAANGHTAYSVDCRKDIPPIVRELLESEIPKIFQNGLFDTYILSLNGIRVRHFYYDTCLMFHALDNNAGPVTSASSDRGASIIKPYSLAYLASVFSPFPYWKDSGKDDGTGEAASAWKSNWERFSEYNAMDALGTFVVAKNLKRRLEDAGRWEFYKEQYVQLLYPILDLSLRGVRFDVARASRAVAELRKNLIGVRDKVESLAGKPLRAFKVFKKEPKVIKDRKDGLVITYRTVPDRPDEGRWIGEKKSISNIILQRFLYDPISKGGLGLKRQTKDGHTTSDEIAIRNLILWVKDNASIKKWKGDEARTTSFLQAILEFRELEKTLSFLASKAVDNDGRIRAAYGLNVQTGRLRSSGNPSGTGYNLQNISRTIRHFFLPDKLGKQTENEPTFFVELDLKQAEDLVVKTISSVVAKSEEPLLLVRAVQSNSMDIHRRLASVVFGVPPEAITKDQRTVVKQCRHGINNGMKPKRMQQTLLKGGYVFSLSEIERIFNVINSAEPWVGDFHKACRRAVMRQQGIATSWGWQLILDFRFERLGEPRTFNRAYTFIEQSEVGVLLKQYGLLTYWNHIREKYRAKLNMLVHDNVVLSVPRSELYDVISILYNALTQSRRYGIFHPSCCACGNCDKVPTAELSIPAEVKISRTLVCSCEECKNIKPLELDVLPSREEFEERFAKWSSVA